MSSRVVSVSDSEGSKFVMGSVHNCCSFDGVVLSEVSELGKDSVGTFSGNSRA